MLARGRAMWLLGAVRLALTAAAVAYLVAFVAFFGVLAMGRGGAGWFGFVRELTLYLFLPLPALLLAALACRARLALLSLGLPLVVFLAYYGPRFGLQPSPAAGASGRLPLPGRHRRRRIVQPLPPAAGVGAAAWRQPLHGPTAFGQRARPTRGP